MFTVVYSEMTVLIVFNLLLLGHHVQGSNKKGISLWPDQYSCDDFKALNNMSWWYDWHSDLAFWNKKVPANCSPMPQHIPMIWTYSNHSTINIPQYAQFILGFNEPDHKDQANLSPRTAANAWREVEKHSRGLPLVSPAPAAQNFHWLDEFFSLCHGCRVDYIGAHAYSCSANHVMSYLHKLYQRYQKKIWLTEFACPQSWNEKQQLHLMETLLPRLEAAHYVFRYSWFEARITRSFPNAWVTPAASLLHNDSSTLTNIGRFYNNFQATNPHIIG
ncbi:uncharacterized protein LOC132734956 [Ruditapes philippinarum]|uniref:uncharacterized protein LOC132734956 n=1 Tax=Ruditapes philippinarum TaxID=129788 RepID=UPI00295C34D3|nr:uncharacterized protein LOC132734956 [Ruditapes philippinarum]